MELLNLTDEQSHAIEAHPDEPLRLVDPAKNRVYVLVTTDVYDRMRDLLADDPRDAYPAIDRAFADGWGDPKMADYDRYEDLKK
jgi:hypothetical protein